MLGAIVGDFVGSRFEFHPFKSKEFDLIHEGCIWTDDSVLTIAVADALAGNLDMAATLRRYTVENVTSYGMHFWDWANKRYGSGDGPYGSWGNGASMRVSPAAWFARDIDECLRLAKASAEVSHNHPEAIRGAQAVAAAIYAALSGWSQSHIRSFIQRMSGYDLTPSVDDLRPTAQFEVKSWISVPRAIICALEATSFEDAIRNAVSLGGDADTEAAIAAAIVEPMFGVPRDLEVAAVTNLPPDLQDKLVAMKAASSAIRRAPLSRQDADAIPAWDPACVERWQIEQEAKRPVIVYEDEPPKKVKRSPPETILSRFVRRLSGSFRPSGF